MLGATKESEVTALSVELVTLPDEELDSLAVEKIGTE